MTKIPVWLDCDPGHDDALAILLALFHPSFELVGISTTYGNSSIENTTLNALSLLTALHKEHSVPVFAGTSKPLVKEPQFAPDIHGSSGLDGTSGLPKPVIRSQIEINDTKGLNLAIWESIEQYGKDLCIVAVGPLTNVAKFFTEYPEARRIIRKLSIMGGGFDGVYNKGFSEFNIWSDPQATNLIFEDETLSPKIILCPLNVTHSVICNSQIQSKIQEGVYGQTELRKIFYELMMFFADSYSKRQKFVAGPPVHDPVAVYVLLEEFDSSVVGSVYKKFDLHCVEDGLEQGKFEYKEDEANGSKVVFEINVDSFWNAFLQVLDNADKYVLEGN